MLVSGIESDLVIYFLDYFPLCCYKILNIILCAMQKVLVSLYIVVVSVFINLFILTWAALSVIFYLGTISGVT